jgi:aryl-phospho-beta-D-glucosidase BglC (GH1 family)
LLILVCLQNRCVKPTVDELKEIYKFRFQTGVNYGGPYVLERWMNGKLFAGLPDWVGTSQDAYNRGVEAIGENIDQLRARLENMWNNYIPECDLALMAQWGINTSA